MVRINSNIQEIEGVGEKTARVLKKLGLNTVLDLLFYIPFRYEYYNLASEVDNVEVGQNIQVVGKIDLIKSRRARYRKMWLTEAIIDTGNDNLKVIWFNQPYLVKSLFVGQKIKLSGKITENNGQLIMSSPEYEKIAEDEATIGGDRGDNSNLVPIYHLTESHLSQKQLRKIIYSVLPLSQKIKEWLPENIIKELSLNNLSQAIYKIHRPENEMDISSAKKRLGFSHLFLQQIKFQLIKQNLKNKSADVIEFREKETKDFVNSLSFSLTNDQKKSAWEILKDLEKKEPMSRLLEGDVGSGKTLVVALAVLNVAMNQKKSAIMVPSEILAHQHYKTLSKLFEKYNFNICLKTRSYKIGDIKKADIIIGTHSLIADKLNLEEISFIAVDEQHRFGVNQRKKIIDKNRDKNRSPHFLSLTATPIPRSLSLAIYGDLDLSIINEMPAGRKKTITKVVSEKDKDKMYDFVKEKIKEGRQIFIVYPLISESNKLELKSAEEEYKKLSSTEFKDYNVKLIHGKMKKAEKEASMKDFASGKIDILIATTVVEVGIDIPNATVMIIEGVDRFGLSQLHQLRGRINRSNLDSYCFLVPSKENIKNEKTLTRLKALEKYHKGLDLAKVDLETRGSGEIFGIEQSGFFSLNILSLFNSNYLKKSRDLAAQIIAKDKNLLNYPELRNKIGDFKENYHLE